MKYLKLLCALTMLGVSAKAQSGFTSKEFDRFSTLNSLQLQSELQQKSFYVATRNSLPDNEVQIRFKTKSDPEKVFLAIFVKDKVTIINYETTLEEQQQLKKSLPSGGFIYKETTTSHGEPSIKYMKDGGISKSGIEIEFGVSYNNGQKHYGIMLWNWRGYKSKYGSMSQTAAIVPLNTNDLDGDYQSGSHMLRIKNGKVAICLMGQLYINAVVKKAGDNYKLFFLNADKSQYSAGTNWTVYSTVQNIASLSLLKSTGEIKMEWTGLWNVKTYKWEYDTLDGDPNTELTFKKS